jgi:hypothetical protein
VTSRLHYASTSPDWARYDTLVSQALLAFGQDVMYAVQVVESARSISDKKRKTAKRKVKV